MIEALGHREQERDDAERLLAMLRVTLTERICEWEAHGEQWRHSTSGSYFCQSAVNAYRDVLSLLGPEETYVDDGTEPF